MPLLETNPCKATYIALEERHRNQGVGPAELEWELGTPIWRSHWHWSPHF